MRWKYVANRKRLSVYGTDSEQDIRAVKTLINEKKINGDLSAIVYQKSENSTVAMIIRGRYLENMLKSDQDEQVVAMRPSIKSILKQINEANTRQATYSGLILYSTGTKRFLYFTPKNLVTMLLGDYPLHEESPPDTVCRVAKEDGDFDITPNCLVALTPIEIEGTTYYSYLCFTEREFKPNISPRLNSYSWKSPEAMQELSLHPSVVAVFEKDKKLHRLMQPIDVDFEQLIDEILHSS